MARRQSLSQQPFVVPSFNEIIFQISEIDRGSRPLGSPQSDRAFFYRNNPDLKPFHNCVLVGFGDGNAEVVEVFTPRP